MAFDTVSDLREWLGEEPSVSEAEEALDEEKDDKDRVTAKRELNSYIEEHDDQSEDEPQDPEPIPDTTSFTVAKPYNDKVVGEAVQLDPDSSETKRLRRGGFVRR